MGKRPGTFRIGRAAIDAVEDSGIAQIAVGIVGAAFAFARPPRWLGSGQRREGR